MSSKIFQQILAKRGIKDLEAFISPAYEDLHDPTLLPDIKPALKRLKQAQQNKELVGIYGDYDIDGLTATALLHDAFKSFGIKTVPFIPDRFVDGYGMSKRGVDQLKELDVKLIITVDCGSRSEPEIAHAKKAGIEVIVTDHHEIDEPPNSAVAVINAKRSDSQYPFAERAGCGTAFALVQAMQSQFKGLEDGQEKWLLDLVALATISDVVPLVDENRSLTIYGLKVLSRTRRPGLKALMKLAFNDDDVVDEVGIGFRIGPRLNAAGRLVGAEAALACLMSQDDKEAAKLAKQLDQLNQERRQEQLVIYREALAKAEESDEQVLVLNDKNWSHGINGIVAAKLVEETHKPAFVMQDLDDGTTKGSARSIVGFSLAAALKKVRPLLISGGGHELAAGATIKTADVDKFRTQLNAFYAKNNTVDPDTVGLPEHDLAIDSFVNIDLELAEQLEQLSPFGIGNPEPVFKFRQIEVVDHRPVGAERNHAKLKLGDQSGIVVDAIGFGLSPKFVELAGQTLDVYAKVQQNHFNGRTSLQLQVVNVTAN